VSTKTSHPDTAPRVALVTGASSGFGAAIARALGALGWPVAIGARRADKLADVAREIGDAGGTSFAHPLDVAKPDSLEEFFAATERAFGAPEVIVSNAGIGVPGLFHEVSAESLRSEIETNLMGTLLVVRRALPALLARQQGDIVFVTSLNATLPRPFQVGYTASKAGVEGAARALQMELEGTGVRASIVRPGPARTEMGWDWDPAVLKPMLTSWKRWGILRHDNYMKPESIAAAVVAVVTAPPGVHLDLVQVNPEGPVEGKTG
jgi:NAD(P)-dependent dehydrogenase (short-subunit alcohol dehydrogenase family)